MANSFKLNDELFQVGDTVKLIYKIKEGEKEREQAFTGILLQIKGDSPQNKMITLRRMSKSGVGVERIIPLSSPYLIKLSGVSSSTFTKAKSYFVRDLSEAEIRRKIYKK
jgi:large subunit ribosomal protein L19